MMKKKLLWGSLLTLAASPSFAQVGMDEDTTREQNVREVRVISSFGKERKTPVAMSTVNARQISEVYGGSAELPEVLKVTPGVYATKTGGGVGDSRINIRGFDQRNVAVTINGIPVNDMENGWVYWSNWAGLGDAVSTIQVQRGLGASKLAINSVGGTMNIITKSTDAKPGASVMTSLTDYGQYKIMGYASTGLMDNGFALTTVLSKTAGNSYVDGTWINGYSYFMTLAKKINERHKLVLTGIGAPQSHGQRSSGLTPGQYDTLDRRFNGDIGYYNDGTLFNDRVNYYHKPQFSLNHYWNVSEKTSVNSSLYYSIGHGGGSGRLGSSYSRTAEGLLDIQAAYDYNVANPDVTNGGVKYAQRNSVNNHYWTGLITTVNHKINANMDLTLGLDARSYRGEHFREVRDLLGGTARYDAVNGLVGVNEYASNYGNVLHVTPVDQRVSYDNDGLVKYAGLFGQLEYSKDNLSAFVTGAINQTSNQRVDRMLYINDTTGRGEFSEKVNIMGYSFKGGANYNINENHNVYFNAGKFSRAPFFSFVFVNNSNDVVQNLLNEKAESFELGYGFRANKVSIKVNAYMTNWRDKSLLSGNITGPNGTITRALMTGANAQHKGIEVEFNTRPMKGLELGGIVSIGDWRWIGDVNATVYSEIDPTQSVTVTSYVDGVHVGDAPQSQYGIQARYQIAKGFYVGATWVYNDRFYSNFDPSKKTSEADRIDSYQIPSYYNLDARLGYELKLGDRTLNLGIQGFNLTDVKFLSDATSTADGTNFAYGFPGFGRNFNFMAKFTF
jgi:iron complex outermembrane receptor protein